MANKNDTKSITQANRDAWNASAAHHRSNEGWLKLKEGFASPGFSTFDPTLTELLQRANIAGKRLVQLGCNNGREILSATSLGASYGLGIDQSEQFITQAQELRKIARSDCSFLCADIYDLPENIFGSFDICLITIGVLNWMPDLPRFFEIVATLLVPGGTLLIYETHPYLEMFEPSSDDPYKPVHSYFKNEPHVATEAITYDGNKSETSTSSYWFSYTFSKILNSCIAANLAVVELQEYPHSNREVGYDIYTSRDNQLPLCFSLVAKKVGDKKNA